MQQREGGWNVGVVVFPHNRASDGSGLGQLEEQSDGRGSAGRQKLWIGVGIKKQEAMTTGDGEVDCWNGMAIGIGDGVYRERVTDIELATWTSGDCGRRSGDGPGGKKWL